MKQPYFVELVGVSGSGKTTYAKKQQGKIVRVNLIEIVFYNMLFLLFRPRSFVLQLYWIIKYRGDRFYTKFMNLLLVHNAKYVKAHDIENAIIDQGHMQNLVSLFDEVMPYKTILEYVRILPKSDNLLVFFGNGKGQEHIEMLLQLGHDLNFKTTYHER